MAELGVAGSAVGIISLGIQVCQGLTQYYGSWKDAPNDVTQMCKSVWNLEETLKVLKATIKDKGIATQAETGVQNNIEACALSINELQGELIRVQEIKGSSIWSKVHGQGRRLLYPFRESTLLKLKGIVAEIRENLSLAVEVLHLQETANSREQLEYTSIQVNDLATLIRSHHNDQESRAIIDWLSPLNFFVAQNDTLRRRQDGTAEWLFETPEFEAWLAGTDRILWCSGLPGAGKTILASAIIDKLQTQLNPQNVGLAFVYFNYRERDTQTLTNLIASLVQQLVQCHSSIPDEVRALYTKYNSKSTPSVEEFSRILQLLIARFSHVYVVVDALDECNLETRSKFIEKLQGSPENLHLLCTSRHLGDIQEAFAEASHLDIRARDSDITRYVEAQILQVPKLVKFCKKAGDLQSSIIEKLVEKANGMFLLAELHLESLKTKTDIRSLRKALDDLPEERDKTYKEALERIQSQPKDESKLAMRVLSWITHAIRPLKVEEIQHAIAVMNLDPGDTVLDEEGLPDEAELITVCGGIVIIDQTSRVIRLVHYTTQEYFNRTRGEWFPNAESEITTTCVTYLSFNVFESGFCQTYKEFKERLRSNQFFKYAAQNWGHHARTAPTSDLALSQAVTEFLKSEAKADASIQVLLTFKNHWKKIPGLKGVHLAAYFGIETAMKLLLESDIVNADLKDNYGWKPISWAAKNGHEAVVRLLLKNGAELKPKNYYDWTPLLHAAQNGHEAVVKLLLENDAKLELKDNQYGQTLLSRAAQNGHEAVVRLLLKNGIKLEPKNYYDWTPLLHAAKNGHKAVVKLLLENDAKLELKDNQYGQTPLSWAARNGHEAIVRLLLENGADPKPKDNEYDRMRLSLAARKDYGANVLISQNIDYGRAPLSWAAKNGYKAIVKLLLERGAKIEEKDTIGQTPLSYAIKRNHHAIVKLLLKTGKVDVNWKDDYGQTLLSRAAKNGHKAIVKLLLERGAKIEKKDSIGQTPLSRAAENGHEATVKLLLETGKVNVDSKDDYGQTPLSRAASNGHEAVVKLLLDMGKVQADPKCADSRTPFSFAAGHGHEVIVNMLLEKGVEVDSKDRGGCTPLLYAIMRGHERVASLLLNEHLVNVNCENEDGQTLLFWAARNGFNTIVQRLLQSDDIDVDKEDKFGTTPLLCAAENGHQIIFAQLLKKGANIEAFQRYSLEKLPTGSWRYRINGNWVYVKRNP